MKNTGISILGLILATLSCISAQTSSSCSRLYRHTRRTGLFVTGQLKIPADAAFPAFKLEVKLSKAVHSVTVRQMKARDTGAHREFVIDSNAPMQNGIITLNSVIRLGSIFGSLPRVTKIVHNGRVLCGAGADPHDGDGDSIQILVPASSSTTETIFYRDDFDLAQEGDELA